MKELKGVVPQGYTQRCPKCKKLTCSFNPDTNSVVCGSCGFEVKLTV